MNYYNEWDKPTAAWLQELINAGHLPPGHVDTRSICDVQPGDLDGYTQCHFFAGIGGWPYALQLAGWPTDRPVWTGSCPCQPFSAAGKRKGHDDERHLWPEMFRLISECKPVTVFGEQVEGAVRLGWLDGVFTDLEGEDYACGAAVLGAHSVGAPHIRQRLCWVANSTGGGRQHKSAQCCLNGKMDVASQRREFIGSNSDTHGLGHANGARPQQGQQAVEASRYWDPVEPNGDTHGLGHANITRPSRREVLHKCGNQISSWSSSVAIPCRDGKSRRVEPSIQPLAHGVSARVVRLRGYGNAIVPACAQAFIEAYMETQHA